MSLRHMVFTPDRNERGNDYKGAFEPEADRYQRWYRDRGDTVEVWPVNVSEHYTKRADDVWRIIEAAGGSIDRIAFMCHGWESGIQLGFRNSTADDREWLLFIAGSIVRKATPPRIALYCCLTGKGGAESFAASFLGALHMRGGEGATIFAHTDAGHTTRNADAALFCDDHPNGEVIAERGTPEYRRFNARLDNKADDLRWRAPYMSVAELRAELRSL